MAASRFELTLIKARDHVANGGRLILPLSRSVAFMDESGEKICFTPSPTAKPRGRKQTKTSGSLREMLKSLGLTGNDQKFAFDNSLETGKYVSPNGVEFLRAEDGSWPLPSSTQKAESGTSTRTNDLPLVKGRNKIYREFERYVEEKGKIPEIETE